MRPFSLLLLLALLPCFSDCTSDQLDLSRDAEMAYADLLIALHRGEATAAREAAASLDIVIRDMRGGWPRPLNLEKLDNQLYHLGKAEWAYDEARESIENGELEQAIVQLDRATYELAAALPAAFQESYLGNIYEFISVWVEIEHAVGDHELCRLDWDHFAYYAKDAKILWRQNRYHQPNTRIYAIQSVDEEKFRAAHRRLDDELAAFIAVLAEGDQCRAQLMAEGVSSAVWELVELFGGRSTMQF